MKITDKVPSDLVKLADRIPKEYGGDLSWKFPDVLKVIDWCQLCGYAILGGETYLCCPEPPHFEPTFLSWYVNPKDGEDWLSLVDRAASEARTTVKHFASTSGPDARYTLDIVDRASYILLQSIQ